MTENVNLQYQLVHRKERMYFALCLIISIISYIVLLFSVVGVFIILFMILFSLFFHYLSMASIRRNGVRISEQQFPDVYEKAKMLAEKMELEKMPNIYVMESSGLLNAFATRFFGKNMVVIFSEIFELSEEEHEDELLFVLAHEFAHLKRRHVSLHLLLLPSSFIPLLREAHMRACEYTCDRYAAYYINNFDASKKALTMLAIGKSLASKVNEEAYIQQISEESGFFAWLSEKLSTHPHLPKRIFALNHWHNPGEYRLVSENKGKIALGIFISMLFFFFLALVAFSISENYYKIVDFLNTEEYTYTHTLNDAIFESDINKMEELISKASIDEKDAEGMTPLQNAVIWDQIEAVEILLEYGADVNTVDNWGDTPLINAIYYEVSPEVVELLLRYGANPNIVDDEGFTAYDYAEQFDLVEYIEILDRYAKN